LTVAVGLRDLFLAADEAGIKLEWVQGTPTWEAFPALRHQRAVERIAASVQPSKKQSEEGCRCEAVRDVYIRFPDGSFKRPDLSIFCEELPDTDEAVEVVPDAIVEVVSRGFEKKDLEVGAPFYLAQGVKNVLVLDLEGKVHHFTSGGKSVRPSPTVFILSCGCRVTV
jgi:Uma2 family endonuclease